MKDKEKIGRVLLDFDGAAEYLGVKPRWVRRAVLEKSIPYLKLRLLVRFDPADLDAYLAASRQEAVSGPLAEPSTMTGAR